MGARQHHILPEWESVYRAQPVERMPWFHDALDADVAAALDRLQLRAGRALDVGTGAGTQAIALAERGFSVVGTDVSPTAIARARALGAERGARVTFEADDILATRIAGPFDIVLDRGCLHAITPLHRARYAQVVHGLLAPGGCLLLKTFSHLQPEGFGPFRFSPARVRALFEPLLSVESIDDDTTFEGTLSPRPRALFAVLRRAREH